MKDLLNLYNEENLGKITSQVIDAYRRGDRKRLDSLARGAGLNPEEYGSKAGKLFKRLMVTFHPDRKSHFHGMIRSYASEGNEQALERMRLNIRLADSNKFPEPVLLRETYRTDGGMIDPDPRRWGDYLEGLSVREENSEEWGFIEAVKALMYGNLFTEFLPKDLYYLEGTLELPWSEIEDLTGLEYCRNLSGLNLEGNRISRLYGLEELPWLTVLYLGRNRIEDIASLSALKGLKTLDISFNDVEDISPLLNLPELEYVNLLGNSVLDSPALRMLCERCLVIL